MLFNIFFSRLSGFLKAHLSPFIFFKLVIISILCFFVFIIWVVYLFNYSLVGKLFLSIFLICGHGLVCDVPENFQISIQDPASPALEGMLGFHHYLLFYLIQVGICVVYFLVDIYVFDIVKNKYSQKFTHASLLEVLWTIFPAIILVFIAVPSFALLYSLDELTDPAMTLKVVGHQWYWSYEYTDSCYIDDVHLTGGLTMDSYMVPTPDLAFGTHRLIEVDNRVWLPINTHIRVLVTSADVLHSWAVPSLGIKLDACPGRISETSLFIKRTGVFYGQCSEICGVNHGFMPIVVQTVEPGTFALWYAEHALESAKDGVSKDLIYLYDFLCCKPCRDYVYESSMTGERVPAPELYDRINSLQSNPFLSNEQKDEIIAAIRAEFNCYYSILTYPDRTVYTITVLTGITIGTTLGVGLYYAACFLALVD